MLDSTSECLILRGEIPDMSSILNRDDFTIMKRAIYATQVIQSHASELSALSLTLNIWEYYFRKKGGIMTEKVRCK